MSDVATKRCRYCAEEIRVEAIRCRYCGSFVEGTALTRTWYRDRDHRRIAGVCAGLAQEFGVSVTMVRLAFVLGTLLGGGVGIIVYAALWIIMPWGPAGPALPPPGFGPPGPHGSS